MFSFPRTVLSLKQSTEPRQVQRFAWVHVRGNRAYVSPHIAVNIDGTIAGPRGKVGAEVSLEQAREAARGAALAMLAGLKLKLGDLDRVTAWLTVIGLINAAPDFEGIPKYSTASRN
jgi:hypothetical protein